MFYRKTIKNLKEQIDKLLRDKELLEREVRISHELSYMSSNIEDLKREFKYLKEDIMGRIIKQEDNMDRWYECMGISKAKTMTELWYEYLIKLGFNIGGNK